MQHPKVFQEEEEETNGWFMNFVMVYIYHYYMGMVSQFAMLTPLFGMPAMFLSFDLGIQDITFPLGVENNVTFFN